MTKTEGVTTIGGVEHLIVHADDIGRYCQCPPSHRHGGGGGGCACCRLVGWRVVPMPTSSAPTGQP